MSSAHYPVIGEEKIQFSYSDIIEWDNYWILDPRGGIKQIINKNREFTVNIEPYEDESPIFGAIYIAIKRELSYTDVKRTKAYKILPS